MKAPTEPLTIEASVALIVTDSELVLNVGSNDGVEQGMLFSILDSKTMNVRDPHTNEPLGSIERVKCRVKVTDVNEVLSIARRHPPRNRGITSAALVLSGSDNLDKPSSGPWPEGVDRGDPALYREVLPLTS